MPLPRWFALLPGCKLLKGIRWVVWADQALGQCSRGLPGSLPGRGTPLFRQEVQRQLKIL